MKIMPVNFGSTDADVANAINLAVAGGAHVLSNSWGWVGAPSATIQADFGLGLDHTARPPGGTVKRCSGG